MELILEECVNCASIHGIHWVVEIVVVGGTANIKEYCISALNVLELGPCGSMRDSIKEAVDIG